MRSKTTILLGIFATLSIASVVLAQDYAVVVNKSNASSFSEKEIAKVFLAKSKSFSNGNHAVPVIQKATSDISKKFIKEVLHKRGSQYKSYWSKMVFTGKGNPPKEVDSSGKVKEMIAKDPNVIGIIEASAVDASVKVVLKF